MSGQPGRWIVVACATVALATAGATATTSASAQSVSASDTVQIQPVASNIAGKPWVTYTASTGRKTAALAADSDETTAWKATGRTNQWLGLDLGGAYDNLRKIRVLFPTAKATYRYVVEASANG